MGSAKGGAASEGRHGTVRRSPSRCALLTDRPVTGSSARALSFGAFERSGGDFVDREIEQLARACLMATYAADRDVHEWIASRAAGSQSVKSVPSTMIAIMIFAPRLTAANIMMSGIVTTE